MRFYDAEFLSLTIPVLGFTYPCTIHLFQPWSSPVGEVLSLIFFSDDKGTVPYMLMSATGALYLAPADSGAYKAGLMTMGVWHG